MKFVTTVWLIVALMMVIFAFFMPTRAESMLYLIFGCQFLILARLDERRN